MVANKFTPSKSSKPTICFCGSFKFFREMEKDAAILRSAGYKVIVPQPSHIRHGHKPQELKTKYDKKTLTRFEGEGAFVHLGNIRKSDIVYIYNKGSYLGPAVTVEIGFSLALGKPIFAKAPIKDITVTNFIKAVVSPKKFVSYLSDPPVGGQA
jgi:nucleoside 2-deoxyribosyltransferase